MKYECIYLRAFAAGSQARKGNCRWLARYTVEQTNKRDNTQRLAVTDQPKFHGCQRRSKTRPKGGAKVGHF
ncbi:MAG: hypothetical protein RI553_12880, partial [Salibaculum sp.]|nr:hypothetical protein [Salibaculum sp.]